VIARQKGKQATRAAQFSCHMACTTSNGCGQGYEKKVTKALVLSLALLKNIKDFLCLAGSEVQLVLYKYTNENILEESKSKKIKEHLAILENCKPRLIPSTPFFSSQTCGSRWWRLRLDLTSQLVD
jgi:hypothetical protein